MERRRALKYAVVVAGLVLTGVSAGPASSAGFALEPFCAYTAGRGEMKVGDELWVPLPQMANRSDSPIEVTGATAVHVPEGVRVRGFSAYDAAVDTMVMGGDAEDTRAYKNLSLRPIRIPARTVSTVYPMVHLQLTRPGSYALDSFQIEYAKDGHRYTQAVGCGAELSTLPPAD
ncbi:hypothetical protein [Streptomyces sp. NBC_01465]|uniref:hypothetical protein n=1 Tax=Streptomyces sp. NBC_01465 TaxID=2903878 RepID=UPI002E32E59A|nr:hypothetical protein [Streptomyces sp. NBC_01465]